LKIIWFFFISLKPRKFTTISHIIEWINYIKKHKFYIFLYSFIHHTSHDLNKNFRDFTVKREKLYDYLTIPLTKCKWWIIEILFIYWRFNWDIYILLGLSLNPRSYYFSMLTDCLLPRQTLHKDFVGKRAVQYYHGGSPASRSELQIKYQLKAESETETCRWFIYLRWRWEIRVSSLICRESPSTWWRTRHAKRLVD
jgi:hypothetical protein